jgi:two-component system, chemotaxis family, protein-glutamate methylesterase/glutaminase
VYATVRCVAEFDLVVIVGSQGALAANKQLLGALAPDLAAPVVMVQHRLPGPGALAGILQRFTRLTVRECDDQEKLRPGTIVLAPADRQLRLRAHGRIALGACPPGAPPRGMGDPVLASAAEIYGPRVLAVVLSGRLDDGAAGVRGIKRAGGRVIVQSPGSASCSSMPTAALATGCVDLCLDPARIGAAISTFVSVPGAAALFGGRPVSWAWPVGA